MRNVLIVGAGQLGSRHLQGAVQSKLALNITVVDPSVDSLDVAKLRVDEVDLGNITTQIQYLQEIEQGAAIDVCIIATTANVRYNVFYELISKCSVKNIIFEKVLFQKESEYAEVEEQLISKDIKAWVNCPRRIFPAYRYIQSLLTHENELKMSVTGSNWGLASNAIHFIDLFSYLTGSCEYQLDDSLLNDELIPSKRSGFFEVNGRLIGKAYSRNGFELFCSNDENISVDVHIITPNFDIYIKETSGEFNIVHNGLERKESYKPLFQSQLTNLNIEEIIEQGNSSLTTFSESRKIHLPFICSLKQHIESLLREKLTGCPIT